MFKVKEIEKSFKNKEVLKGVTFEISEGDRVALLGGNGAGKSTLLKIIAGQIVANSGEVDTSLDFQTEISMMPQADILIDDLTVFEIVSLKCKMNKLSDVCIEELLMMVELQEHQKQYVGSLSGGQKRRLSLLLTILNSPKLIFLDEPTTGLHAEDIRKLLHVLQQLVEGGDTVVVIEHNLDVIKMADHIIDLGPEGGNRGGTIVATGTPEEIVKVKESYTGIFLGPVLEQTKKFMKAAQKKK